MATTTKDDLHIGMMGDGTEEQNLGQPGNPKARITQEEVEAAFSGSSTGKIVGLAAGKAAGRAAGRATAQVAGKVSDAIDDASDTIDEVEDEVRSFMDEQWLALKDRAAEVRDQVAASADMMRDWAGERAAAVRQTAADKPVLVVSLSAATALTLGLAIGFLLGRAVED